MDQNGFKWAHGSDANLVEPVQELAERGFQLKEIPKASNMNWIFKKISDDFKNLNEQASNIEHRFDFLAHEQDNLGKVVRDNTVNTHEAYRHSQENRVVSDQLRYRLQEMEKRLRDMNEVLTNTNQENHRMYTELNNKIQKIKEALLIQPGFIWPIGDGHNL